MRTTAAIVSALLFVTGCAGDKPKPAEPEKPDPITKIEPGTTTRAELVQLMGAPMRVLAPAPDMEIYQYDKQRGERETQFNVWFFFRYSQGTCEPATVRSFTLMKGIVENYTTN